MNEKVIYTNGIPQCPYCKKPTRRTSGNFASSVTCVYYPPMYNEQGININPDRNNYTSSYYCCECNNNYTVSGNSTDGFYYVGISMDLGGKQGERIGIDEPIPLSPEMEKYATKHNEENLQRQQQAELDNIDKVAGDEMWEKMMHDAKRSKLMTMFYTWFRDKYGRDSGLPPEAFDWIYDNAITGAFWETNKEQKESEK